MKDERERASEMERRRQAWTAERQGLASAASMDGGAARPRPRAARRRAAPSFPARPSLRRPLLRRPREWRAALLLGRLRDIPLLPLLPFPLAAAAWEDCLLCPTGFSANTALMTALGSISSLLARDGRKPAPDERIAIFSDALNHAATIDGIRLAERQQEAVAFVYNHSDMSHLEFLLSSCSLERKVVITDSMDGDFTPLPELVMLRKKYGFLLVVDDAHGTLVCGENGGGILEQFGCENDIDICLGSLSKGVGCQGGFIACSTKWKRLILSRGRSFIFSTALPVPVVASVHAAISVSKKERWRRSVIWEHVQHFASLTKLKITSPIIVILVGSEEAAVKAHRCGFLVQPIRPPVVPPNSSRLRITLSAAHSSDDIKRLTDALTPWLHTKPAEQSKAYSASRL